MRQRFVSHLTFANVVSLIALFVALGGTAIATDQGPNGCNLLGTATRAT